MDSESGEIVDPVAGKEEGFRRFDVVSDDHSDHYYATKSSPKGFTNATSGVHKKIMQEWKLLDKDLPESIYVRVYEARLDLLRAAIVGARGTPYHDFLFFFDIAFPSDYPNRPPFVYYRSFGFRLNPNLYATGRVCLSLLNTWTGKKSEKWDPSKSSILQVLLSIQALVLNEKPYFNEPGIGALSGRNFWEKKSAAYNETVFILNCKSMLCLIRKPPRNFEPLVNGHFKDRAEFILRACDVYRNGVVRIGNFYGDFKDGKKVEVSGKFKGWMDQIYGDLVGALQRTGASVGHFVELVKDDREKKEREKAAATTTTTTTAALSAAVKKGEKKAGGGLGKSFVKKLKNIFFVGWKKSKTNPVPVTQSA